MLRPSRIWGASQPAETLRTQLAQARQAQVAAEPAHLVSQASAAAGASVEAPGDQPVKRTRGRPPAKRHASVVRQPAPKTRTSDTANQAPVQWWTDGWTPPA